MIRSKQVEEWQGQALLKGRSQGASAVLLNFLRSKYGDLPEAVEKSVQAIDTIDQINVLLIRAAQSPNLDEWRKGLSETRNGVAH